VKIVLPKTVNLPELELEWKIPKWSNTLERDRARSYFQAYAAAAALYFVDRAMAEVHAGRTATSVPFKVPDEAIGCGFHEAVRGVLSHHVVIRGGKVANYHPYPPTPWNASPRDSFGTPGPYEDAVENTPIFEESSEADFKGIDIMRTVRSFDPCLPCGVHMAFGDGKVLEVRHAPMYGVQPVTMGETPKPPARPVTMGETPKPPARPVTMGETPKPPARPVTMGETPKPPARPASIEGKP
jgi:hydrogenase large subunit